MKYKPSGSDEYFDIHKKFEGVNVGSWYFRGYRFESIELAIQYLERKYGKLNR